MEFEFYKISGHGHLATVGIQAAGVLSINRTAMLRYNPNKRKYARLGCDENRRLICIEFIDDAEAEGAHHIKEHKTCYHINSKGFFLYFFGSNYVNFVGRYFPKTDDKYGSRIVFEYGLGNSPVSNAP